LEQRLVRKAVEWKVFVGWVIVMGMEWRDIQF
jgi:hypothetical protein